MFERFQYFLKKKSIYLVCLVTLFNFLEETFFRIHASKIRLTRPRYP